MTMVRWEPFGELLAIQDRMGRLFDESYRSTGPVQKNSALAGSWAPNVDIYETEAHIVLKAEVPGIDPADVNISIEDNTLTLEGKRQFDEEVKRENYHRVERAYGSFSRAFTLPRTVDQDGIKAEYKDGVLVVSLPRRAEALPKQIVIDVTK